MNAVRAVGLALLASAFALGFLGAANTFGFGSALDSVAFAVFVMLAACGLVLMHADSILAWLEG